MVLTLLRFYYSKYKDSVLISFRSNKEYSSNMAWLIFIYHTFFLAGLVDIYQNIYSTLKKEFPLMVLLWFYIGGSICSCICCYMPIYASGDLMTSYLIDYMSNHFKIWSSLFEEKIKEVSPLYQLAAETPALHDSENR